MLKNICKILTLFLIITMLFQTGVGRVFAYTINDSIQNIVYIDGIEYVIKNTEDEIIIMSNSEKVKYELHLKNDGTGFINYYDEFGKFVKTDLKVNSLLNDKIDIEYIDENGNIAKIDETDIDEYKGQMAATAVIGLGTISIKAILTYFLYALIVSAGVVVISGVTYKALDYALKNKGLEKSAYYQAEIYKNSVYISTKKISKSSAISRVRSGKNIYTYNQSNAKSVVSAVSYNYIGPEIDKKTTSSGKIKKGIYYYHYHTKPRNGAHAFYGQAYVY